jgi:hypothetical protein
MSHQEDINNLKEELKQTGKDYLVNKNLNMFALSLPDGPGIFIDPLGKGTGPHIKELEGSVRKSRHKNYTVVYTDENGDEQSLKFTGSLSRTVQQAMEILTHG